MHAIGEIGSAARTRVRFQDMSDSDSVNSNESEASSVRIEGFEIKEDPSFWKDHNVQVVIRVRPLNSHELSLQGHNKCVRQETCQAITWTGHPESRFTFDIVADEHVSQEKLFKVAGVPMVENCVAGYNSCMFAYGQTGSGKTHTMLGDIEGGTRRHSVNCGMTPRVFEYLFSRMQKEKEARRDEKIQFTCKCSFLEIYNEQILDLLDPSAANLQIREDAKKGVHVENLTEFEVSSARDVMQRLTQGADNRKVAATNMNRASSRSHSVFTCVIESKWEAQGVTHHRFARLNLVDLAGSERQKSSGAEGDRLKEASNINKSLSTLGLVIMNLVGSSKKSLHIPYRDSKLTFLLQDSLGGNSKTIIIANISPSNCCALETLSTLKFAQRAKFIRNNAIVNEDASGDVLAMRLQIQQLKKEVNRLQGLVYGGTENCGSDTFSAITPGSPGAFKWEGVLGSFSPLTFDKRLSQRKEYEAALVAAFRRERDKEAALKALAAVKQAAEQLAIQRTDELRSLKMILRFREEGIKRLEAVNTGKLSAETHLLQEKEELQKEIEVLRNHGDRNPEVTRFAMENLHLREELRRLQAFVEEGEREMLNEQITVLQDKLLETLDWKLMHEKDTEAAQDQLSLNWDTSVNDENEFLNMQAIQNQNEVDTLRKKLTSCLEAKEKLERRVDELVSQLKEQKSPFDPQIEEIHNESTDDQKELETMVDAIAAASHREAEAHEAAIILAKENEELREKINVLIEDNNKLIELYESTVASGDIEHLQHQLHEMHEENDKLLGLYEKAMQEKDELKILLSSHEFHRTEASVETKYEEKMHELLDMYEKAVHERDEYRTKLDLLQDRLATAGKTVKYFGLLELRAIIDAQDQHVQLKQQELASLRSVLPRTIESAKNKLLALKVAVEYWHRREEAVNEKKEEVVRLKIRKEGAESTCMKAKLREYEIICSINRLKSRYKDAESQKKETEKVLFAIDSNKPANFGKASEMLKSEEERSNILVEIKKQREQLAAVQKEIAELRKASELFGAKLESLESGILREAERKLDDDVAENGVTTELSRILVEYQEGVFESDLKEEEIKLWEDALQSERRKLEELREEQICAVRKMNDLLSDSDECSRFVSEKVEEQLADVQRSLADAKLLLVSES